MDSECKGRVGPEGTLKALPPDTSKWVKQELQLLDGLNSQRQALEGLVRHQIQTSPNMPLLKTLPGVGDISATVIAPQVGLIGRFQLAEKLAGNGGITPKVNAALPGTRVGPPKAGASPSQRMGQGAPVTSVLETRKLMWIPLRRMLMPLSGRTRPLRSRRDIPFRADRPEPCSQTVGFSLDLDLDRGSTFIQSFTHEATRKRARQPFFWRHSHDAT